MSHQAVTLSALIPKNQNLVVLQYDSNVKHALEVLYSAKITAVPVVQNKKLVGMLDVLDLVAFLARLHKKSSTELTDSAQRAGAEQLVVLNKEDTPEIIQKRSEEFLQTKVGYAQRKSLKSLHHSLPHDNRYTQSLISLGEAHWCSFLRPHLKINFWNCNRKR